MKTSSLRCRFRIYLGEDIALGPGKIMLLEQVETCGSIKKAAEAIGMSYMRAWKLIQTMNECFREPLIHSERGGPRRGGATLTATGHEALRLYRELEERSLAATGKPWKELQSLFKP